MSERATQFLRSIRRWQPLLILVGGVIWTIGTAAVAGWWTYYTFNQNRIEDQTARELAQRNLDKTRAETEHIAAQTRKLEAQRPFLQKQLDIYLETMQTAGKLTNFSIMPNTPDWDDNVKRFWQLRWGELEMVGDAGLMQAARRVAEQLNEVEFKPNRERHDLRWMVCKFACNNDPLRGDFRVQ
jgi:hypothetical protein